MVRGDLISIQNPARKSSQDACERGKREVKRIYLGGRTAKRNIRSITSLHVGLPTTEPNAKREEGKGLCDRITYPKKGRA